jgi:hypothetical protein
LRNEGFTYDFNQNSKEIILHPENYIVNQIYQYEGNSSPDDSAIVYGIVSKFGLKGVFVSGSSANSVDDNAHFISKLAIKAKNDSHL